MIEVHEEKEILGKDLSVRESDAAEHETGESEEVDGRGRRFLLKFISVSIFLAVLVGAVSIVAITGFNSLMTHEEEIKGAWERIQTLQAERRDLLADLLEEVGHEAVQADLMTGWRQAQSTVDEVASFQDEVAEQPAADRAFRRVFSAVREVITADESGKYGAILARVDDISRLLGMERRFFNEKVGAYRVYLERLPTRWLAGALRFEHIPDYGMNGP